MAPRRKGHDPVHGFRAPGDLVAEAKRIAAARDEVISDVIRRDLVRYVKRYRKAYPNEKEQK